MAQNILRNVVDVIRKEYDMSLQQDLYYIRSKIITINDSKYKNDNSNKYCFLCQRFDQNLKLRQINTLTRVTDEIISSQLVCDNCI